MTTREEARDKAANQGDVREIEDKLPSWLGRATPEWLLELRKWVGTSSAEGPHGADVLRLLAEIDALNEEIARFKTDRMH